MPGTYIFVLSLRPGNRPKCRPKCWPGQRWDTWLALDKAYCHSLVQRDACRLGSLAWACELAVGEKAPKEGTNWSCQGRPWVLYYPTCTYWS